MWEVDWIREILPICSIFQDVLRDLSSLATTSITTNYSNLILLYSPQDLLFLVPNRKTLSGLQIVDIIGEGSAGHCCYSAGVAQLAHLTSVVVFEPAGRK